MPKYKPVSDALVANLLLLATSYAKARKIEMRSVSRMAHGDPPAFDNLATGDGSISLRKYDTSMAWFFENWPADLQWPKLREPFPAR